MYYDNDESSCEILIQHLSLDDVLAFIVARDEVRRIPSDVVVDDKFGELDLDFELVEAPVSGIVPTMRAVGYVLEVEAA